MSEGPPNYTGVDQEVHDLLAFLHDFAICPVNSGKKSRKPVGPMPGRRRQPLGTLKSNRLFEGVVDTGDNDSLTTNPSVKQLPSPRQSWANRMSQALQDWKVKHQRCTEERLAEQHKRLAAEHESALQLLRNELHEHYLKEFNLWKDEFLSSLESHVPPTFSVPEPEPVELQSPPTHDMQHGKVRARREFWKSPDGKKITCYRDGTRLEENPDGSTLTRFANGDVQTTAALDESPTKVCYYYGSTKVLRMDQSDGSVIWCFPNGQREKHFVDGRKIVTEWAESDRVDAFKLANVNL